MFRSENLNTKGLGVGGAEVGVLFFSIGTGSAAPGAAAAAAPDSDWHRDNMERRARAVVWIMELPDTRLKIMRICLEAHRRLMQSLLEASGKKWQRKQWEDQAQFLLQPCEDTQAKLRERFKVLLAFRGTFTTPFQKQMAGYLQGEGDIWSVIPCGSRSPQAALLAYTMCARSCAAVHFLLTLRHRNYPFRLFDLLLQREGAVPQILADRECPHRMDVFSADFVERFHHDLAGPDSIAALDAIGSFAETDMATIEAGCVRSCSLLAVAALNCLNLISGYPPKWKQGK